MATRRKYDANKNGKLELNERDAMYMDRYGTPAPPPQNPDRMPGHAFLGGDGRQMTLETPVGPMTVRTSGDGVTLGGLTGQGVTTPSGVKVTTSSGNATVIESEDGRMTIVVSPGGGEGDDED
jgi:hypothetical protein